MSAAFRWQLMSLKLEDLRGIAKQAIEKQDISPGETSGKGKGRPPSTETLALKEAVPGAAASTFQNATKYNLIDVICYHGFTHYDLSTTLLLKLLCCALQLEKNATELNTALLDCKPTVEEEPALRYWILTQLTSRNQKLSRTALVNMSNVNQVLDSARALWTSIAAASPTLTTASASPPFCETPSTPAVETKWLPWTPPIHIDQETVEGALDKQLQTVEFEYLPTGPLAFHYIGCSGESRPLRGLSYDLSALHLLNVEQSFSHRITGGALAPPLSREDTLQELRAFFEQPTVQYFVVMFGGHARRSRANVLELMLQNREFISVLDLLEQWVRAKPNGNNCDKMRPRLFLILDCCNAGYCLELPESLSKRNDLVIHCAVGKEDFAIDHVFAPMFVTLNLTYRTCLRDNGPDEEQLKRILKMQARNSQQRLRDIHSVDRSTGSSLPSVVTNTTASAEDTDNHVKGEASASEASPKTTSLTDAMQMMNIKDLPSFGFEPDTKPASAKKDAAVAAAPSSCVGSAFTPCMYVSWQKEQQISTRGILVTFPTIIGASTVEEHLLFFPPEVYRHYLESVTATNGSSIKDDVGTTFDTIGGQVRKPVVTGEVTVGGNPKQRIIYKYTEKRENGSRLISIERTNTIKRQDLKPCEMTYTISPDPHNVKAYRENINNAAAEFYKKLAQACGDADTNYSGELPPTFKAKWKNEKFTCTSASPSSTGATAAIQPTHTDDKVEKQALKKLKAIEDAKAMVEKAEKTAEDMAKKISKEIAEDPESGRTASGTGTEGGQGDERKEDAGIGGGAQTNN